MYLVGYFTSSPALMESLLKDIYKKRFEKREAEANSWGQKIKGQISTLISLFILFMIARGLFDSDREVRCDNLNEYYLNYCHY